MRRLLAVTTSAFLLALVLAVPALAAPMDPPYLWGAWHSAYDKVAEGESLGQATSRGVHDIQNGELPPLTPEWVTNFGEFTQYWMDNLANLP